MRRLPDRAADADPVDAPDVAADDDAFVFPERSAVRAPHQRADAVSDVRSDAFAVVITDRRALLHAVCDAVVLADAAAVRIAYDATHAPADLPAIAGADARPDGRAHHRRALRHPRRDRMRGLWC